ncbi:hypothetical protein H2LOC_018980 [Methylocystis heyeri]|uniref:Anti-sigma factor NepR domain-containing protein n=2 Tax=Methylocystis heyeri TaxID=391905 RepID=A0A6B8KIU0_9HYPH|nr:hypothetical protein H2LOC_018980 [Methylocystis heyeri]
MRPTNEEPMAEETRSRPSKHIGADSQDRASDDDNSGKVDLRRESSRREPLALLDRGLGNGEAGPRKDFGVPRCAVGFGATVSEHIGKELRSFYDDIVAQPVPDRFLDLLNELEADAIYRKDGS